MEDSKMPKVLVTFVLTNVLLVSPPLPTVLPVLLTENKNQKTVVHVKMDNGVNHVLIVNIHVPPVKTMLSIVLLVPTKPDTSSLIVAVKTDSITSSTKKLVELVESVVPDVKTLLITVLFVLIPMSLVLNQVVIV
jgi:hypothetical protein